MTTLMTQRIQFAIVSQTKRLSEQDQTQIVCLESNELAPLFEETDRTLPCYFCEKVLLVIEEK